LFKGDAVLADLSFDRDHSKYIAYQRLPMTCY
jgi:hypothetical protein